MPKGPFMVLPTVDKMILNIGVRLYKELRKTHTLKNLIISVFTFSVVYGLGFSFLFGTDPARTAIDAIMVIMVPICIGVAACSVLNSLLKVYKKSDLAFIHSIFFWTLVIFETVLTLLTLKLKFIGLHEVWILSASVSFGTAFVFLYFLSEHAGVSAIHSAVLSMPLFAAPLIFKSPINPAASPRLYLLQSLLTAAMMAFNMTFIIGVINNIIASNLGTSGIRLMSAMLSFMAGSNDEIENVFDSIGSEIDTFMAVVGINCRKKKLLFVVPSIHPGPFAKAGGADLPYKIQAAFPGRKVFCFHGTASHDQNPTSRKEIDKITSSIKENVGHLKFPGRFSKHVVKTNKNVCSVCQYLGIPLIFTYKISGLTDDIDPMAGAAFARSGAAVVDCHNQIPERRANDFWKNELILKTHFADKVLSYGQPEFFELISASNTALNAARKTKGNSLRVGYGAKTFGNEENGIGKLGVRVAVVEVDGQKTAYILVDGNNMLEGLRDRITESVSGMADRAVIATTDNHEVNSFSGSTNPVGENMPFREIAEECRAAVEAALANMEPAQAAGKVWLLENVRVLGRGRTEEIFSSARTVISLTTALLPMATVSLIVLTVLSLVAI